MRSTSARASTPPAGIGTDYAVKFREDLRAARRARAETQPRAVRVPVALAGDGRITYESEGTVEG